MGWPKGKPRGSRRINAIEQLAQETGQDMSEILPGERSEPAGETVGIAAHHREPKLTLAMIDEAVSQTPIMDAAAAIDLLRQLLEATRVKMIVGYRAGRCLSCNRPHPANMNICKCVCHRARAFLAQLGVEVAT